MNQIETEPNIGKRIAAGLVDYIIIYAFFFIYVYSFGKPTEDGGYRVSGFLGLVPVLFWGLMTVGLEQLFGATLGNGILGLKPKSIKKDADGQIWGNFMDKPTFGQSFKRHLLDPIDMFFFGLVGIITIKNSELNQRLGDMWAKTVVIKSNSDGK
ncbi:RDD family protein [Maribacter stanieri]|uniref:RDD family protein n=1 Tax=Maribacter stanieri TaxID=440514 RepID=UPI0024958A7C|nr:RDD family protein [Maribacter stanieri]